MLTIVLAMIAILTVCALVLVFVAYPYRGQEMPLTPWLGQAMRRLAERLPVLEDSFLDREPADRDHRIG